MALFGVVGDGGPGARAGDRRLADREHLAGAGCSTSTCRSASLALAGVVDLRRGDQGEQHAPKLDWIGFGTLSIAIAALQLFLDRGAQLDWFDSSSRSSSRRRSAPRRSIFSLVHTFTAENSFINPRLFLDRNFSRRADLHLRGRHHLSGIAGADDALSADADGLSGGDGRHRRWGRAASAPWSACSWSDS